MISDSGSRREQKISQQTFAERIGSSQSRVAKMEAGDPSVSIDLLIRSLLSAGSTKQGIGRVIADAAGGLTNSWRAAFGVPFRFEAAERAMEVTSTEPGSPRAPK